MSITLSDDREYAWLLVRSDTLVGELAKLWRLIPVRPGSWLWAAIVFPIRLLFIVAGVLFIAVVTLGLFSVAFELPVLAFAYVHRFLPTLLWQVGLWTVGVVILGFVAMAVGVWLSVTTRKDGAASPLAPAITEHILPPASDPAAGYDRWRSVHVGHDNSRAMLFAGNFIGLGIVVQCLAVLGGAEAFAGPVDVAWRWPVLFGEQLFHTMLLGITAELIPGLSAIVPATTEGRLLLALVSVFHASAVFTMMVLVMASSFKPRELFKGTTRDLADYLENADTSSGTKMMIHRVGVVRPLDEQETVSLTKAEFVATISKPEGDVKDGTGDSEQREESGRAVAGRSGQR